MLIAIIVLCVLVALLLVNAWFVDRAVSTVLLATSELINQLQATQSQVTILHDVLDNADLAEDITDLGEMTPNASLEITP